MKKITELRSDYIDDENLLHIDCWFDNSDNSEGTTVALIDLDTNKVIFLDNLFRLDEKVKEAIAEVLSEKRLSKEDYVLWDTVNDKPKERLDLIYHYTSVIELANEATSNFSGEEFKRMTDLSEEWQNKYLAFLQK
jgi:hypothetical protein